MTTDVSTFRLTIPVGRRKYLFGAGMLTGSLAVASAAGASPQGELPAVQANKELIRRLHEEVQRDGDFALFDQLFADDYVDRTPFGSFPPDREGTRKIYQALRDAFAGWRATIHLMVAAGDLVATYKTYVGVHRGEFLGIAPTAREVRLDAMDFMRVKSAKIVEHWGIADGAGLLQQLRS